MKLCKRPENFDENGRIEIKYSFIHRIPLQIRTQITDGTEKNAVDNFGLENSPPDEIWLRKNVADAGECCVCDLL